MAVSLQEVEALIDLMFADRSVPESVTKENLESIKEHCEILIETLSLGDD